MIEILLKSVISKNYRFLIATIEDSGIIKENVILERHKMFLRDVVEVTSGSPQFRISESITAEGAIYKYYGQTEVENDLINMEATKENPRTIQTIDKVNTICEGDIIFSLISGRATLVRKEHEGYIYTQNYLKLVPDDSIDKNYLIFLLNESEDIARQWNSGLQGSIVIKHTVKQLKELELNNIPTITNQVIVGDIYIKQLRLKALKERVAKNEDILIKRILKEVH